MGVAARTVNPYDYTNVVKDPRLFAGRREELKLLGEEIDRLGQDRTQKPIVAIIGERRVGKTSLLLRAREIALRHEILSPMISLTETTGTDAWEFWREILDGLIETSQKVGLFDGFKEQSGFGFFHAQASGGSDGEYLDTLRFGRLYIERSTLDLPTPPSHILRHDLGLICGKALEAGHGGVVLLIDEAHQLLGADDVQQQIRDALQHTEGCGIVFAGERGLGQVFNDPEERLFAQGRVVLLENFVSSEDVAECALLPLTEDERPLVSPMTVDYLTRLGRGKPNEVRLICNSIYKRFQRGQQDDLNISVEALDDVLENIESAYQSDYDLKKQVDTIRSLSSVDLEALYAMTRYPDWSVDDIVELDEAFRGEDYSTRSAERRKRLLRAKHAMFSAMGLMSATSRFTLAGDEFLYLYLRFWYEVRKHGELSRRLVLGKAPPTLFGEKAEKLVRSVLVDLGIGAEFVRITMSRRDTRVGQIPQIVRRRFSRLNDWIENGLSDLHGIEDDLGECFHVCELVKDPGDYYIIVISLRNLANPRESIRVELYITSVEGPVIVDLAPVQSLRDQANKARVAIEDFEVFPVKLTTFEGLLQAIGAPKLDDLMTQFGDVLNWRIASVQRLVQLRGANGARARANMKTNQLMNR